MALFHGGGTKPALGRREIRYRGLQLLRRRRKSLLSLGPQQSGLFLPVTKAEGCSLLWVLPNPKADCFSEVLAHMGGGGASEIATALFLN